MRKIFLSMLSLLVTTSIFADVPEDYKGKPFNGEPFVIPGSIKSAEFDRYSAADNNVEPGPGIGKGIVYDWSSPGNPDTPMDTGDNTNRQDDGDWYIHFISGGTGLGWLGSNNNWTKYTVKVAKKAYYNFQSNGTGIRFTFSDDAPVPGEYKSYWKNVLLEEGTYVLKVWYKDGPDAQYINVTESDIPVEYGGLPFGEEAYTIPGILDVKNFDRGGEGVSWHWLQDFDALSGNDWYRDDFPCISGNSDDNGLGWLDGDQNWIIYTVKVEEDGLYNISIPDHKLALDVDFINEYPLSETGNFTAVPLTAGLHTLKFHLYTGNGDYKGGFVVEKFVTEPYKKHIVPVTVECEDFDKGGEGVSYHWVGEAGSTEYREDANFISDGDYSNGHALGWRADGNWALYTLDVLEAGEYDIICDNPIRLEVLGGESRVQDFFNGHFNVKLKAGENKLKVYYDNHVFTSDYDYMDITKSDGKYKGLPFKDLTLAAEGVTEIAAEDFDKGGRNISFHWNCDGGGNDAGRGYGITVKSGSGFGWINGAGDDNWLVYTVNAEKPGLYTVATPGTTTSIEVVGESTRTEGYAETHEGIHLNEGLNVVKVYVGGGADFAKLTFELTEEDKPEGPTPGIPEDYMGTPFTGEAIQIPGTIECIFFDKGGRDISWNWNNDPHAGTDRPGGEGDGVNFVAQNIQLGWLNNSDENWAKYTLHVTEDGFYDFKSDGVNFRFTFGDDEEAPSPEEVTTKWQKIYLQEGDYVIKIWYKNGSDAREIEVTPYEKPKTPEELMAEYDGTPFNEARFNIPGTIPCEQFDRSETGKSFEWTGGDATYREDAPFAYEGGIGWTGPDKYVIYSVNIQEAGYYKLTNTCHGTNRFAAIKFEVDFVPAEGTYSTFTAGKDNNAWIGRTFDNVYLPAGEHLLKMVCAADGFDIQSLDFEYLGAEPVEHVATPFGGTPQTIPGYIQFEDFDEGGFGVGYNWMSQYNVADDYRDQIYFIGTTPDGGHNVGYNDSPDNDWLQYTVNVEEEGDYEMMVSAANDYEDGSGSGFAVEVDGVKGDDFIYERTEKGWDNYFTYVLPYTVNLTEGEHVIKVYFYHTNADYICFYKAGTTGIDAAEAKEAKTAERYTIGGVRTNVKAPGLYIVKNGKEVKKVIVK